MPDRSSVQHAEAVRSDAKVRISARAAGPETDGGQDQATGGVECAVVHEEPTARQTERGAQREGLARSEVDH